MEIKCQYCQSKSAKEQMLYVDKKYYHNECKVQKDCRDMALDLFYSYTKSLALKQNVYMIFSKIKSMGFKDEDVLYIMRYIVKNNLKLNYPPGILYYVDRAIKDREYEKNYKKKQEITVDKIEKIEYIEKKELLPDKKDISQYL